MLVRVVGTGKEGKVEWSGPWVGLPATCTLVSKPQEAGDQSRCAERNGGASGGQDGRSKSASARPAASIPGHQGAALCCHEMSLNSLSHPPHLSKCKRVSHPCKIP